MTLQNRGTYKNKIMLYIPPEKKKVVNQAREIMEREGESLSKKFLAFCEEYVRLHSDGNPQMLMPLFLATERTSWLCEMPNCNQNAEYEDKPKSNNAKDKIFLCLKCHESAKERGLLRGSKKL